MDKQTNLLSSLAPIVSVSHAFQYINWFSAFHFDTAFQLSNIMS